MKYINKIEINYFRSIHKIVIKDLSDVNIFTGMNDVGKSNVLKALNLFFNNETESGIPFNFQDDFNLKRLTEVRKTVKGRQFIQIKITFIREKTIYEKTLPKKFTVSKIWYRDSRTPVTTDDIENQLQQEGKKYNDKSKSSLTRFLNKIKYYYVPAIKDEQIFQKVLSELRDTIYDKKLLYNVDINKSLNSLYDKVSNSAESLNDEYFKATNIKTVLASPKNIAELFRTLNVDTKLDDNTIKLDKRGDGIRVRYLPSILNYIASNSNNICIWGFEEPENSLEFNFAYKMAESFINDYSKNSEILLTTHSPAFISFKDKNNVQLFRCFNSDGTKILLDKEANELPEISEELGYSVLMQEYYDKYINERKIRIENNESLEKLKLEIERSQKTVLLTEGKTDVILLKTAWGKLYDIECPFEIKSCDIYSDEHEFSAAGCDMLAYSLRTCRFDNNHKIIGLFDRDEDGLKSYKLDKNFIEKKIDTNAMLII